MFIGNQPPKVVPDPICGLIDIRRVLPIIETEEFQALADKRQLGMSYLVFRSATHTRLAHSLGSYHATRVLADRWVKAGFINKERGDALAVYALLHDIGHPAFSHVTEDFCVLKKSADPEVNAMSVNGRLSFEIICGLKAAIEASEVDFCLVKNLAKHEDSLVSAVSDKNLGMEKLDYLERDGFYTILSRPAEVDYLRQYVYFIDGNIVIDEKVVDSAIDTQNFYMKMYKSVYLRKSLVIAQRMFHKMVYRLISAGELSSDNLPCMTDSELLGIMFHSADGTVRNLHALLRKRELFREAIVLRPKVFMQETRTIDKPINVFGISQKQTEHLICSSALQKHNHWGLEELENVIANVAGIPRDSVLVVPVFNPERFRAQDVMVYGSDGNIHSLKERRPAHFSSMEETARSYFALRVCTLEKYRELLASPDIADRIIPLLV